MYPGRAAASQILDVFIHFLSLGVEGYKDLLSTRPKLLIIMKEKLTLLAEKYNERVLKIPGNTISLALTLTQIP